MAKLSPESLVYTSAYGARDPIKTNAGMTPSFHEGVDFGPTVRNKRGVVLQAIISGTASWLSDQYGALGVRTTAEASADLLALLRRLYGNVREGAVVRVSLWHLESRTVRDGAIVAAGSGVGVMGSTGLSTGVHVHAELSIDGKRVDPKPFIDAQASRPVDQAPDDYPRPTQKKVHDMLIIQHDSQVGSLFIVGGVPSLISDADRDALVAVNVPFTRVSKTLVDALAAQAQATPVRLDEILKREAASSKRQSDQLALVDSIERATRGLHGAPKRIVELFQQFLNRK